MKNKSFLLIFTCLVIIAFTALNLVISKVNNSQNLKNSNTSENKNVENNNPSTEKLNISYKNIEGVEQNLLSLDIYNINLKAKNKPVAIMIHGGGWTTGDKSNQNVVLNKKEYFKNLGYLFISLNYRLAPNSAFPSFPQDVADGVNWVYENIANYGGNKDNILLMGHSAGAHLAMLVVADKTYKLKPIQKLILLDGAGYDVPLAIESSDKELRTELFEQAFSKDKNIQIKASPIFQISPNQIYPEILIFYVQKRADSKIQSSNLNLKLNENGYSSKLFPIKNTTHEEINTNFGKDSFEATEIATNFLKEK